MSDTVLGGYDQGIKSNPTTAVQTVEPGGLVDLTEAYAEDGMSVVDELVSGLEHYKVSGKLQGALGPILNVNMEPGVTALNGVMGAEGLFTTIKEGFIKFIQTCAEYIVKAYQWVKARIRVLLGFDKSAAQIERCDKLRDAMQDELETLLKAVGAPADYDLAVFFEGRPKGLDRLESITFVKNKLDSETESVQRLEKAMPEVREVLTHLRRASESARKTNTNVKRAVDDLRRKVKNGEVRNSELIDFNRLLGQAQLEMNDTKLIESFNKMIQTVYDIPAEGLGLNKSLESIREKITNQQGVSKKVLTPDDIRVISATCVILNRQVIEARNSIGDMNYFDQQDIDLLVNVTDATLIEGLAVRFSMPQIKQVYTVYAKNIKDYASRLELTARTVNTVLKEAQNIIDWKNKADALLAVYLTQDLEAIHKKVKEMQAGKQIADDFADADGKPHKFTVIKYIDGKSTTEVLGAIANKAEFSRVMPKATAAVNNFAQQAGLNVKV